MIDDMQVNCTGKLCNANLNVTSCEDHYWLFATVRHLRVECRNSRSRVQTVSNALEWMDWQEAIVSTWHQGMPLPTAHGLSVMADHAEKVMEKSFFPE